MQIVIEIPEETVNKIKNNVMFTGTIPSGILWDVTSAIINGVPLPKRHGRLIDADELLKQSYRIDDSATLSTRDVVNVEEIDDTSTIIEADKQKELYQEKLKEIADELSEKFVYLNTCPNERDIILGYLGVKRPSGIHCDTDCTNTKCESNHHYTKSPSIEPEIIRCRECKHYDGRPCGIVDWYNTADDFCSRGEKNVENS